MLLKNIDSIEVGSVSASVTFPKNTVLPEVGTIVREDGMEFLITGVDKETRTVHFINRNNITKEEVVSNFKENFDYAVEKSSEKLFRWKNSEGMSQFIVWTDLPEEEKVQYKKLTIEIIKIFSERNVTILSSDDIDDLV